METHPAIKDEPGEDFVRKQNAWMKWFFKIPFPEKLSDDDWMENVRQLEFLADSGLLGVKEKK